MAVALVISGNLSAQNIILPDLLRGDIVLQQQTDARIWGKAKPGSAITVSTSWNGRKYKVTAPSDSLWSVKVATPQASYTQYEVVIASDKEKIVLDNVLIGDVWFCGGQSNMEMPSRACSTALSTMLLKRFFILHRTRVCVMLPSRKISL